MLAFHPHDTPTPSDFPSFSFEVTASLLDDMPHLEITGQPSNVAIVTEAGAILQLNLVNSLPPGWSAEFDREDPILWHDFCGVPIAKPDWITGPTTTADLMSVTDTNPVSPEPLGGVPSPPIIVGFRPLVVFIGSGGRVEKREVPDPTIINIDPVGG